ncbi:MAG: hypothetical protein ACO3F5_09960, partial [Gemmatimonadaceae bacterium]
MRRDRGGRQGKDRGRLVVRLFLHDHAPGERRLLPSTEPGPHLRELEGEALQRAERGRGIRQDRVRRGSAIVEEEDSRVVAVWHKIACAGVAPRAKRGIRRARSAQRDERTQLHPTERALLRKARQQRV